jgi:hypothetical protein
MYARTFRRSPRRSGGAARSQEASFLRAPPSGALINAVVQHADLIKDLGGNQSLMRLSPRRSRDPRIVNGLGREGRRLSEIAVIWDDEEDQIVRVLDEAAGDGVAAISSMEPLGEADVMLTCDALAYLHASGGRVH